MAIYTKTGDKGETGLFSSDRSKKIRISKASLRVEAIGSVDEANTFLGLAASFLKNKEINPKIIEIQKHLFEVGAILAGVKIDMDKDLPQEMEKEIDEMDKRLPKLTHFILPGGGHGGSLLFMARTFIRRAERRVVSLSKKEKVNTNLMIYLNRLSDYVYTLARYSNFKEGIKEKAWRG
ncbi:MAG: ATP-cobalamin adenosyltransferase [uncultured bacterium]|uniref:Corrinoid adenosyltransferase n=1 Tax=Candidatus Woesebacteria bacterium GW2011_GWA1_40_43 TaxID=1618553 RepID=A0A0G0UYA6_9BACT|nr:MAG: ATP-cobalamin adenosyltransferase [uncultured bacterium]KKR53044.1 MAG: Cob(I)alamin adenosyltransferase [Candidatus Woesebacteria bacterium GW2011_GWD2_40_19]KKR58728.1 MAG: Cob(I)alamin adenosyltransferase [Candidatus Woesebacteria bacterium GW2011_GWC2_40_30]KKR64695.1 MAG: Cob(I)alamin adenosyltransferase [Candidatus Woesebacteria bacterium GW2011_GWA1_40_43]HAU65196.1 cob(I)yrinic acid a,c-diamide adenosyltransferase [Candidatus Woesebacteria bacterium]